jgi:predicted permease
MWRDLVFACRQTPVWISALTLIAFLLMVLGLLFGAKQQFAKTGIDARLIVFIANFFGLFFLSSALGHASSRQPNAYYDITRALPFSAEQHIRYLVLASWLEGVMLLLLPLARRGW